MKLYQHSQEGYCFAGGWVLDWFSYVYKLPLATTRGPDKNLAISLGKDQKGFFSPERIT